MAEERLLGDTYLTKTGMNPMRTHYLEFTSDNVYHFVLITVGTNERTIYT